MSVFCRAILIQFIILKRYNRMKSLCLVIAFAIFIGCSRYESNYKPDYYWEMKHIISDIDEDSGYTKYSAEDLVLDSSDIELMKIILIRRHKNFKICVDNKILVSKLTVPDIITMHFLESEFTNEKKE